MYRNLAIFLKFWPSFWLLFENLKKHLILAVLIFNIDFLAIYIARKKKGLVPSQGFFFFQIFQVALVREDPQY